MACKAFRLVLRGDEGRRGCRGQRDLPEDLSMACLGPFHAVDATVVILEGSFLLYLIVDSIVFYG